MSTANHEPSSATHPNPSKRTLIVSWVAVVLWAGVIFFMSAKTSSDFNDGNSIVALIFQAIKQIQFQLLGTDSDLMNSVAHFCEYTVFGALLANALRWHMPLRRAWLLAILCASAYGITDEFHQLFVPGRSSDPVDWLVDTLGATLGASVTYAIMRRRNK